MKKIIILLHKLFGHSWMYYDGYGSSKYRECTKTNHCHTCEIWNEEENRWMNIQELSQF